MIRKRRVALPILIMLLLVGCFGAGQRVNVGETFTLLPEEKATIVGTGLTITLETVGEEFAEDGGGVFAEVTIQGEEKEWRELYVGEEMHIEGYTIALISVDYFGDLGTDFVVRELNQ